MRWRILMTIFGLIAAIALLFFAVNFFVVQQAVRAYNEVHSQAHTELIPSLLTLHYANFGSWEGVEMELVQLNVIAGTEVTIVDQDGTIVVSSGPDIPGDRFITRSDISREIPIFDEAGEKVATAYVQLSLSSQTIDRAFFGDLMQGSTVSIAIAAVVGMVIATLLAGSISRPIQRIDQAARSLILGDYKTRIPTIEHRDEIASLAETFNQMADGLEATETLRRKLVADLSHDFRTPLTVLNGYVEGLADGRISDRATALKVFERMSTEIDYLNRLVDGLSHSARWDSGRLISEPAPVDVAAAVKRTVARLTSVFEANRSTVRMATANDGLVISVDPQMFDQLLYNLIYNASAHNPAGTEIEIGASIKDEQVKIWVTDDGLGIPNADQDRIFERFVRLDAARGRKQGGSGMGLSIVKTIVEAHDGSIEVLSPVANGRGTSFRVRFVGMGSSGK